MPHIRKTSRISSQAGDHGSRQCNSVEESSKAEVKEKKVIQSAEDVGSESAVGLKQKENKGNERDKNCCGCGQSPNKLVIEEEENAGGKSVASGDKVADDGEASDTTTLKDKKVKFSESAITKHADNSAGHRKHFGLRAEKHKSYHQCYKESGKPALPLATEILLPPVTALGEIAVITDLVPDDPISACLPCLEVNGTYICTPCNPRCFIIQKVTTSPTGAVPTVAAAAPATPPLPISTSSALNPNAHAFEGPCEASAELSLSPSREAEPSHLLGSTVDTPCSEITDPPWTEPAEDYIPQDGYAYMNGDVGKLPSGVVFTSTSTPDPLSSSGADYSSVNGVAEPLDSYEAGGEAGAGPGVASPPVGAPDTSGIPLDQLKQMLSSQLEYYFSRENLANDAYLISQMDNDQYVPIWTVANFNQVKKLTTDIKLITEVLRESPNVQVDEEGQRVRPNHKRCIVILREIPDSTPLEEVKNLFSGEGCPKLISCEFAHNNSWYVTFESDEDAQRAYRFLREEVKEFQGKPIMARIKAKPMNRLSLPPVGGGNMGTMKNGYRTPPSAYDPSAGPFQAPPHPSNPSAQQRFLYANGSSIQPSVNYGNQVHVYTFQQPNQPFYPPTMLQPWGAANTYFDIGSVFSVNGLAPQQSFSKPINTRYVPRARGNKRPPQGSERSDAPPGTGLSRQHHMTVGMGPVTVAMATTVPVTTKPLTTPTTIKVQTMPVAEHNHSKVQSPGTAHGTTHVQHFSSQPLGSDSVDPPATVSRLSEPLDYRPAKDANMSSFSADRHRRRRKEEETTLAQAVQGGTSVQTVGQSPRIAGPAAPASTSPQPPALMSSQSAVGPQFDLQATAFPPLPGMEAGGSGAAVKTVAVEASNAPANDWGENRLADVVKGTAKPKAPQGGTKEKDEGGATCSPPRAASPLPLPSNDASKPGASTTSTASKTVPSSTTSSSEPKSQVQDKANVDTSSHSSPCQAQQLQTDAAGASQTCPVPETKEAVEAPPTADMAPPPANSSSTTILTPPPSPIKCVVPVAKCMTADKSTKTDDILLNGEGEGSGRSERSSSQSAPPPAIKPNTTNAATMTSSTPTPSPSLDTVELSSHMDLPPRLSYAQVAQHHKEKAERIAREKHNSESDKDKERKHKDTNYSRELRDKRETASSEGFREVTSRSSGRALARQAQGAVSAAGPAAGGRRQPERQDRQARPK